VRQQRRHAGARCKALSAAGPREAQAAAAGHLLEAAEPAARGSAAALRGMRPELWVTRPHCASVPGVHRAGARCKLKRVPFRRRRTTRHRALFCHTALAPHSCSGSDVQASAERLQSCAFSFALNGARWASSRNSRAWQWASSPQSASGCVAARREVVVATVAHACVANRAVSGRATLARNVHTTTGRRLSPPPRTAPLRGRLAMRSTKPTAN
jgi:hypothetical protein